MTPNSTGPRIPILSPAPRGLTIALERLEDMGYVIDDCSADETLSAWLSTGERTAIALVPVTHVTDLGKLSARITTLRASQPEVQVFAVYAGRLPFKSTAAFAAGIDGLYSLPFEDESFLNKVFELAPMRVDTKKLGIEHLMRVNVLELAAGTELPFNVYVYLPMNRKTILYAEKGRALDDRAIKKFRDNKQYALYILRADLKSYLDYTRKILDDLGGDEGLSVTDRGRRRAEMLVEFMGGFFSDDSMSEDDSTAMLENLKSVLDGIEDESGGKHDLVEAVEEFAARQMTHLSHARNVAAYCALFGAALGNLETETLRMGGLLHDLGLSDLPSNLIGLDLEDMSADDAAKYKLHPGGGKFTIDERKLKVPRAAVDMILYHHELPDGSGYPYGKRAADIPAVAKICAFADEFDKLTSVRPGKRQLTPLEAMRRISGEDGEPPQPVYEEAFHRPLVDLFLKAQDRRELDARVDEGDDVAHGNPMGRATVKIGELLKESRFMRPPPSSGDAAASGLPAADRETVLALEAQLAEHWLRRI